MVTLLIAAARRAQEKTMRDSVTITRDSLASGAQNLNGVLDVDGSTVTLRAHVEEPDAPPNADPAQPLAGQFIYTVHFPVGSGVDGNDRITLSDGRVLLISKLLPVTNSSLDLVALATEAQRRRNP